MARDLTVERFRDETLGVPGIRSYPILNSILERIVARKIAVREKVKDDKGIEVEASHLDMCLGLNRGGVTVNLEQQLANVEYILSKEGEHLWPLLQADHIKRLLQLINEHFPAAKFKLKEILGVYLKADANNLLDIFQGSTLDLWLAYTIVAHYEPFFGNLNEGEFDNRTATIAGMNAEKLQLKKIINGTVTVKDDVVDSYSYLDKCLGIDKQSDFEPQHLINAKYILTSLMSGEKYFQRYSKEWRLEASHMGAIIAMIHLADQQHLDIKIDDLLVLFHKINPYGLRQLLTAALIKMLISSM